MHRTTSPLRPSSRLLRGVALALLLPALAAPSRAAAEPRPADPQPTTEPAKQDKAAKPDKAPTSRAVRKQQEAQIAQLQEKHRLWLQMVEPLISDTERAAFLALEKDYQRDAFIDRFWEVRDPYGDTGRNEFRDRWESRIEEVQQRYHDVSASDERPRLYLLNGAPIFTLIPRCSALVPMEIWFYRGSDRVQHEFIVVFYQRWGAGPYRVWTIAEGEKELFDRGAMASGAPNMEEVRACPQGDDIVSAIRWVQSQGMLGYSVIQQRFQSKFETPKKEWVASFNSYSTDLPKDVPTFPATLTLEYPGHQQNRTLMQGLVSIPAKAAGQASLGEHRSYDFVLNGEVLAGGKLFDSFRYKFDFPVDAETQAEGAQLPLAFQRLLRPGDYNLVLKLEDLNAHKFFRTEQAIQVPLAERAAPLPPATPEEAATARLLAEANAAIKSGETTVKLVPPRGEMQTGMMRFETLTTGAGIDKVTFAVDGKAVLTKKRPPFSVELDLGNLPRPRTLTVTAFDAAGQRLADDQMVINAAEHRFRIRLTEPQRGKSYKESLLAQAQPEVPDGETLERVEYFLNDTKIATLFQPPWSQPIVLPKGEALSYVRAVAYLADGNSTEDLVFVNAPDDVAQVNVDLVELYTTVVDRSGHPVLGLAQKAFAVAEDGVKQEIVRFERVDDLPIHTAVVLDVSASMEKNLDQARQAALQFLQATVRPKDRAAVVTFNDHPSMAVKFTKEVGDLAGGLAGLKAERGTALYDTIVFSLYYFNGIKGQRAILLLSDGKDESSRFTYDETLEYARRAGVAIYSIGLGDDVDRKKLDKLSEETGARAYFVRGAGELPAIYSAIEQELRSKYLIAYQSSNNGNETAFRTVELKVAQPGAEAKTIRGYYP
jgi:Ca-activated chloride channel family protein